MNDDTYTYDYQENPTQGEGCCVLDRRRKDCVNLSKNDAHCGKLAKCCVGISSAGLQRRCLNAVRKCRGLGNNWDPIAPLRPLDVDFIYNETPGYTTQGKLVLENFGGFGGLNLKCIIKNGLCGLVVAYVINLVSKGSLKQSEIIALAITSALIKCILFSL